MLRLAGFTRTMETVIYSPARSGEQPMVNLLLHIYRRGRLGPQLP